jgi:hypothetical protein
MALPISHFTTPEFARHSLPKQLQQFHRNTFNAHDAGRVGRNMLWKMEHKL